MDLFATTGVTADHLFTATVQQQSSLDELSNRALTNGIDLYMNKRYDDAAKEFQRAIGLSPQGLYASDAANYLADAYLKMDKTEKAIDAYQQSIQLDPFRDDTHVTLGNLYFSLGRHKDAEKEYREAVRLNPSATNHYSLGQAFLEQQDYGSAERQFNIVKRMAPEHGSGDFGMGLVRSRQERYEDAIRSFQRAITKKNDLYDAYAEMGYAYADIGDMESAQEMVDTLEQKSPSLGQTLRMYMYEVDPPKFSTAYSTNFFTRRAMNTPIASMDNYLATPGASKTFSMKFVFDKEMDRESVENRANWTIGRAAGGGPGERYNFGLPVADTEIAVSRIPDHVFYDDTTKTATVLFTLAQNETGDGTIDPAHIEFTFSGRDKFGYKMNPAADQFTGFKGIA